MSTDLDARQPSVAMLGACAATMMGERASACRVDLLPGRAAYLPGRRTLLVADLHLGKAATFRDAGVPVPEGSSATDLERLLGIVTAVEPRRVIVLGDLFHAATGCTEAVFDEWRRCRRRVAGDVVLVPGNHDRRLRLPPDLGLEVADGVMIEDDLSFHHEPPDDACGRNAFCGHVHPRLSIRAPGGDRCTDRCFVERRGVLTLPAFATFAGASVVRPEPGTRLWAAGDGAVVEVTRMAILATR